MVQQPTAPAANTVWSWGGSDGPKSFHKTPNPEGSVPWEVPVTQESIPCPAQGAGRGAQALEGQSRSKDVTSTQGGCHQ